MRIFIITQDEPVYIPVYLAKIIQKTSHSIVGITALSPAGKKGWASLAKQRLDVYGPIDFVKAVSIYCFCRLMSYWPTRRSGSRFYSVAELAAYHSIPVLPCSDVNSRNYVRDLRELNFDILVSVAANQRFRADLLSVPRLVCLNVHSALLPKYRGLDGLFWALVHGETQVGVTVHLMNRDFDDGAIIGQQPFDVSPDDTLHTLYFKAMDVGATLLARAFDDCNSGAVVTRPNKLNEGSYFSWPNREAAQRFRANGRRFF